MSEDFESVVIGILIGISCMLAFFIGFQVKADTPSAAGKCQLALSSCGKLVDYQDTQIKHLMAERDELIKNVVTPAPLGAIALSIVSGTIGGGVVGGAVGGRGEAALGALVGGLTGAVVGLLVEELK